MSALHAVARLSQPLVREAGELVPFKPVVLPDPVDEQFKWGWRKREYDWRKCPKLNWVRDGEGWSIL